MKKKHANKSNAVAGDAGQSSGYVVGLVSASLGGSGSAAASGALASLFSSSAASNSLLYLPAPQPEAAASTVKQEASRPSKEATQTQKKPKSTKAEKNLQSREQTLKNADDEDREQAKKVKHKKAQQTDETLEERPTKRQRIAQNRVAERVKMKRTVFVGNLPVNFKKKDLKKIFRDLGAIESVRFRSVVREDPTMSRRLATIRRQVDSKKPSINAYVVFKEEDGAVNALQRNGMEVEKDVYIRVDRAGRNLSHDHKRSIFVGNLPYDIMELQLRQHFEDCGKVEAVRLVRDRNSGVGKGFGYVLFENTDSVMLALKLDGSQLLVRKIRVKRSVKKEKVKNSRGPTARPAEGKNKKFGGKPQKANFKGAARAESNTAKGKPFKKSFTAHSKTSASFKGEVADTKNKGLKKKFKPKNRSKPVHI